MADFFAAARQSKTFCPLSTLTDSGWLSGMYLKPQNRRLVDSLNQGGETVVLTNAFVPGRDEELDFLSVRRSSMLLVLPEHPEGSNQNSGMFVQTTPRKTVMLAGLASLSGIVDVPQNLRVTDWFARHKDFVQVRSCTLTVRNPHGGEQWTRELQQLLVRSDALVAVSEVE